MTASRKLATSISETETPASRDRELPPSVARLPSRWVARYAAQPSSRISDPLTVREHDVLAMLSQGCSNKRIARTLEISPETVKSRVKHIFLKLEVGTRAAAAFRAVSLELL
jgi:DNA-binding NarL/FixJ family response regulator